jgi:hypothetical protein
LVGAFFPRPDIFGDFLRGIEQDFDIPSNLKIKSKWVRLNGSIGLKP